VYNHKGEQSSITQMLINHDLAPSVSSETSEHESPAHESVASKDEDGDDSEYDEAGGDIAHVSEWTGDEGDLDDDADDNRGGVRVRQRFQWRPADPCLLILSCV